MTVTLVQIIYEIHTFAFDSDDGMIMMMMIYSLSMKHEFSIQIYVPTSCVHSIIRVYFSLLSSCSLEFKSQSQNQKKKTKLRPIMSKVVCTEHTNVSVSFYCFVVFSTLH